MTRPIVGVDLSLTATGLAWNDGRLRLHGRAGLTDLPLMERGAALLALADELRLLLGVGTPGWPGALPPAEWPALVLIETLPTSRTAVQAERAYLWHEFVRQLVVLGVPVVDVTPGQIKQYVTGHGGAGKGRVIEQVTRRFPAFETGGDDNLADATVLAAMGADLLGAPLAGDDTPQMPRASRGDFHRVPAAHRKALAKIVLPPGVERAAA
jgi:crossover junction endodeoxyribonuclease RuvC